MGTSRLQASFNGTPFAETFHRERRPLANIPFRTLCDPDDPRYDAARKGMFRIEDLEQQAHVTCDKHAKINTRPKDAPYWSLPGDQLQIIDSFDRRYREGCQYGLKYKGLTADGTPVIIPVDYERAPYRPDPVMHLPDIHDSKDITEPYELPGEIWRDLFIFDLTVNGRIYSEHEYHDETGHGIDVELRALIAPITTDEMRAAHDMRVRLILLAVNQPDEAQRIVSAMEQAIRDELHEYGILLIRNRTYAPAGPLAAVPRWTMLIDDEEDDPDIIETISDMHRRFEDECWARVFLSADMDHDIDMTLQPTHPNTRQARRNLSKSMDELLPGENLGITYIGIRESDGRAVFLHTQDDELMPDVVNGRGLAG